MEKKQEASTYSSEFQELFDYSLFSIQPIICRRAAMVRSLLRIVR